jgi:DNA-binding phage protein
MAGYLKPYRTYVFRNKDPIIDKTRTLIADDTMNRSYREISDESGVSHTTLYNWFHGKTRRPQFATVNAVAMALGHELAFKKLNGKGK